MTLLRTSAAVRSADRSPALPLIRCATAAGMAVLALAFTASHASAAAIVTNGTAQTATIATTGQVATFTFTATAGQRVSALIDTVTFANGAVELRRVSDNMKVARATLTTKGAFIEPTVLDAGSYELRVSAGTATGSARVRAWAVVDATVNGAVGTPSTIAIATPGQSTSLRFTGTAGQTVTARAASSTMVLRYELRAPDGTLLASSFDATKGLLPGVAPFIDQTRLPAAGTYSLVVNPQERATGSVSASVIQVADVTGTLALGTPSTGTTTLAGQSLRYSVALTSGRRVSLRAQSSLSGVLSLLSPAGVVLASRTSSSGGAFVEPVAVPATGTYTVLFDPVALGNGQATLTAFDVDADVTGTLTLGADATPVALASPGQNARLTFTGTAGARISVGVTGAGFGGTASLVQADGTVLASRSISSGQAFVEPVALPAAGTYTIVLDPAGAATGSASVRAFDVPADTTAAITLGGAAVTATIAGAGQTARLTFSGTAGQRISLAGTDGTFASSTAPIKLLRPTGTPLAQMTVGTAGFIEPITLPSTGTYTVLVDPNGSALGSIALRAFLVTDLTSSATIGEAPAATVIATPGQVMRISFTATANTKLKLTLSQSTLAGNVSVLRPAGTRLAGPVTFNAAGRTISFMPTTTGTHTILIDPSGAATGAVSVAIATA